jgi:transcriptional antiterminator RfaH
LTHSSPSPLGDLGRRARRAGDRWYVAETEPRKEAVAIQHLERQSFRCFCPRLQKVRRHARRIDTVLVPLFPGYVFVSFDADRDGWRAINGTRGVRRVLTSERLTPLPMPDDAIAALLERYDGEEVSAAPDLRAGDSVLIVSGPFAEQYATIESLDDKGRVRLLFDILGGGARFSLDASRVARLDKEPG